MARELDHPPVEQIGLSGIYDALSDPVRRQMVLALAAQGEQNCAAFGVLGSKTNLSYHFARLRGAGLTLTRLEGTSRYIQLRRADLAARFPGLLDAVIAAARDEQRVKAEATKPLAAEIPARVRTHV